MKSLYQRLGMWPKAAIVMCCFLAPHPCCVRLSALKPSYQHTKLRVTSSVAAATIMFIGSLNVDLKTNYRTVVGSIAPQQYKLCNQNRTGERWQQKDDDG